jgi:hypothetical protein
LLPQAGAEEDAARAGAIPEDCVCKRGITWEVDKKKNVYVKNGR